MGRKGFLSFFRLFLLSNLCFFSLQLVVVFVQNGSFISAVTLPLTIYLQLFATLFIHISLYVLLSLFQTFLLISILKRSWHYFYPHQWFLIIWALFVCFILSVNAYFFPLSLFSKLFLFLPPYGIRVVFYLSSVGIIILLVHSLLYPKNLLGLFFLLLLIGLATVLKQNEPVKQQPLQQANSNVIILGIDSLSPESIHQENMPFLNELLHNSTQFTHAISPLARTYPAWVSILTGLYAEHHHAEENLIPKQLIASQKSIAWILEKKGYDTLYATDDRRFNSLDESFGFQHIIGPKLGVNDILLGSFNDFPLSNVLINSNISATLFPYNYSNRASFFSYYPATFDARLRQELSQRTSNKPIFLAVHFTLPHWPYAWAESSPDEVSNEFSVKKRARLYQQSLSRVDQQFASFFNFLKENHYFHNSFLIILSDHGEVLYYPNSRLTNYQNYQGKLPSRFALYLQEKTATVLNKSAGHGSDLLSPKQYHSVLAFNIYENGKKTTPSREINTRIALIDLAPTILDFLHLKDPYPMDGISLLPAILKTKSTLPERSFFIESGMFPNQLLSKEKAKEIGAMFYRVNPASGELEIKPNKLNYFEEQKLYGIISKDWILALYPDENTYIAIIQNLSDGQWTDDLHSPFAQKTPAKKLYQQLQSFYGKKLFLPLP